MPNTVDVLTPQRPVDKPGRTKTIGYAAHSSTSPLQPFSFDRREPGPNDVQIEILYCGVCHSDLHTVRNEWENFMPTTYPAVPGHEIVGRVSKVGHRRFANSRRAIWRRRLHGRFLPQVRELQSRAGELLRGRGDYHLQQPRQAHLGGVTYGGYSKQIVVDENYVLKVPDQPRLAGRGASALRRHHHLFAAAPLEGWQRPEGWHRWPGRPGPHGR